MKTPVQFRAGVFMGRCGDLRVFERVNSFTREKPRLRVSEEVPAVDPTSE